VLATWPTPVEPAPRLAVALGLGADDLWIKRDDLTGLGGGGNKIRKLQYSCADAIRSGATTLVTCGSAQSNHARLTAAAAAKLGLRCALILEGDPPADYRGNVALDHLVAATVVWTGQVTRHELHAHVDRTADELRDHGESPYVIPFGGSSPLAAHGYVDGAAELEAQLPDVEQVIVAVGSGGTMAGLVAYLGAGRVQGIDTGALPDAEAAVRDLLSELSPHRDSAVRLHIHRGQIGSGYAALTSAVGRAIRLAAHTEGIFLDPTYTGRALAGLVELVADRQIRPGQRTVFLHTGGLPALFGHPQLSALVT
jgi:L-cysteate sulfo-lyase